ncbi:HTH domain-containing protein [Peptoniphilus sp. AGMB00490]|uniref:HTH domain-containing protein n=1 Tax=Peptoniphilus faecalis TaxID=2731255 RepID=A0A848RD22_9FIRM|nr:HTH domain-containing protein [Peptoniphilus faecalis]NMW84730.1 HTH domain-containing protein [Peptoniphilus faecalis]
MDKQTNGEIPIEDSVLEFIKNRETAKVREIDRYFNLRSERTVRRIVEKLRERGEPICMGNKGYYYSIDPLEIERTINQLLTQASGQLRTAKNLKLTKEKIETTGEINVK